MIVYNNVLNINIKQEALYENISDITWFMIQLSTIYI